MIRGIVNENRDAVIRLTAFGANGRERSFEAVIDTGYDGHLSLPPSHIARLGLVWRRRGTAILADGSETTFDIYEGAVLWDTRRRPILIDEANAAPLVGMRLLEDYELRVQVWAGGRVNITRRKQLKNDRSAAMPTNEFFAINSADQPWEERFNEKLGRALFRKNLYTDPETGGEIRLVRYPAGVINPLHTHPCGHGM